MPCHGHQYSHGFVDNPTSSPSRGAKASMQGRRTLKLPHHAHLFFQRLGRFQLVCRRITFGGKLRHTVGRYTAGQFWST